MRQIKTKGLLTTWSQDLKLAIDGIMEDLESKDPATISRNKTASCFILKYFDINSSKDEFIRKF